MEVINHQLDITTQLLYWYSKHKRDLPWRETTDPYRVWLSEVILQQTRIAQGWDYYLRFVDRFPDIQSLAEAEEDEVLKLWQGLGYYTRARNLHTAAKQIMRRFNGRFPTDYSDILSLKGVGAYTAAAISSIAFNAPHAVVDGNVFRVIARLYAVTSPIDTTEGKKIISKIAQSLIDQEHPGIYNQAIMDFGSLVCTPQQPKCMDCPLQRHCQAFQENKINVFPVISHKTSIRERYFNYFHIEHENKTYLQKRNGSDIWKNLYEFPLIETPTPMDVAQLSQTKDFQQLFPKTDLQTVDLRLTLRHQLTHQIIHAKFYRVTIPMATAFNPPEGVISIEKNHLSAYPVSRLTDKYIKLI